jgi:hypothetical protein
VLVVDMKREIDLEAEIITLNAIRVERDHLVMIKRTQILIDDQVLITEVGPRYHPMKIGSHLETMKILEDLILGLHEEVDHDLEVVIGTEDLIWAGAIERETSHSIGIRLDLISKGTLERIDLLTIEVVIMMDLLIGIEEALLEEMVVIDTSLEIVVSPQRGATSTEIEEGVMIIDPPIEEAGTLVVTKEVALLEKSLEADLHLTINQLIKENRISSNLANRLKEQTVILHHQVKWFSLAIQSIMLANDEFMLTPLIRKNVFKNYLSLCLC